MAQVFIDSKKSPLLLVLRSLSSRKSIASIVPIGLRMRRSTYIFFSTLRIGEQLFLARAGSGDVDRREDALVGDLAVEHRFPSCRCP